MSGSSIGPSSEVRVSFMFILPVVDSQCSETNVMQFLFSFITIKGLYMFRALLEHPQEALHERHLVYCVRHMSVGCTKIEVELRSSCSQLTSCSAS
jgi:hypothetical protein